MQKWEYLFVTPYGSGGPKELFYPRWINGVEQKNWDKGVTIYQYTAQLGNDGWDLGGVWGGNLIFKREKS